MEPLHCAPAPTATIRAPVDVYYVVETTPGVAGESRHQVASRLYEMRPRAEAELERLCAAASGTDYSVWKASTYIEPARWAYDVELADGTLLRHGDLT